MNGWNPHKGRPDLTGKGEAFLAELEISWRELNDTVEHLRHQ